jgi:hypothetical protein
LKTRFRNRRILLTGLLRILPSLGRFDRSRKWKRFPFSLRTRTCRLASRSNQAGARSNGILPPRRTATFSTCVITA